MLPKRPGERASLLLLYHQKIGVAELIILVPKQRLFPHSGSEMEDRHDWLAGDAERHHRRSMMMTYGDHVAPCLIDAAMDDALGIQ